MVLEVYSSWRHKWDEADEMCLIQEDFDRRCFKTREMEDGMERQWI